MLSPELAAAVADLGGFALFIGCILIGGIGLYRRWWVPGWLYEREVEARKVAETQALRNAETLEKLARAVSRDPRLRPKGPPNA